MKRSISSIVVVIILCFFITSCWSRQELNELAIVVGLGVDKIGDQYQISLQMVNPPDISVQARGTTRTPVIVYTEKGDTVQEAVRRILMTAPRRAFFSHLQVLVFGEELAREGIKQALDFFWRNHEFRFDFYIMIAKKNRAENILKILTPLERLPSRKLFTSLETSERYWAETGAVTLDELVEKLITDGTSPLLTGVQVKGNQKLGGEKKNTELADPKAILKYCGMAVFKEDRLVGWLNEQESKGGNYILNHLNSTVGELPCPEKTGAISIEVIRNETKVKGTVQRGKPAVYINMKTEQNIAEAQCEDLDLTLPETIAEVEKETKELFAKSVQAAIDAAQKKYKVDFLGFGQAIHRADPQFWKKHRENWEREFVKMPVYLNIDLRIRHTGKVNNSYIEEMEPTAP